ncbi:MAG: RNA polymerase sigma factor [Armatimonadota bacterium]
MREETRWSSASDEEIVRRVQRGEAKLFSVIFERHYTRLERFIRHSGLPDGEVEDLLADAFARAFARIQSYDPDRGASYLSYLYAVARNLVTDRLRQRGRTPEPLVLEEVRPEADPQAIAPEDLVLWQAELARIREAMERLSPSDRQIITLSYDRELSCREIQEIMGKPSITSVTTHLYKAMKRLRELVLKEQSRPERTKS